jgi:tellurite resistance protein TerB
MRSVVTVGIIESFKGFWAKYERNERQQQFLEATMAASALLAVADGEISFAELMARDYVLDRVTQLHCVETSVAVEIFRSYGEKLQQEPEKAEKEVVSAVKRLSLDTEEALLLMRICLMIAKADQEITPSEKAAILKLTEWLELDNKDLETLN